MRYSILGFDQEKVLQVQKDKIDNKGKITTLKLDMTDLMLLDYIHYASGSPRMSKKLKNNLVYVWLYHKKILEDLPILDIKENMLKKRLSKLVYLEMVDTITVADEHTRGSRSYYAITDKCESLIYDGETKCKKLHEENEPSVKNYTQNEQPSVKNYTSNNKQLNNIDKQLNKTNSKELVQNFSFGKQSSKKENLYSKCQHMIDDFTDDTQIRIDLQDYLQLLLEMRKDGLNFYANNWKGLLRKLKELSTNADTQHKIICQSIEKGYKSFFPVNDYTKPNKRKIFGETDRMSCEQYTEQELEELRKLNEERERQGLRTKF